MTEHPEEQRPVGVKAMEVTLYTRPGCHLCEEAKAVIEPLLVEFGAELREVNIEGDAVLEERYGRDIPVVFVGWRKAAKHRVEREQFRRSLMEEREKCEGGSVAAIVARDRLRTASEGGPNRGDAEPRETQEKNRRARRLALRYIEKSERGAAGKNRKSWCGIGCGPPQKAVPTEAMLNQEKPKRTEEKSRRTRRVALRYICRNRFQWDLVGLWAPTVSSGMSPRRPFTRS
jgi:glutaredoxin